MAYILILYPLIEKNYKIVKDEIRIEMPLPICEKIVKKKLKKITNVSL